MGAWGCPHEHNGNCMKINEVKCDPGMKGCVLFGRFTFSDDSKNRSPTKKRGTGNGNSDPQEVQN